MSGNLNYNPSNGPVVAPWLSWGPYLWADGPIPRSDRFNWLCSDLQNDFTHPSSTGIAKVASELLCFFKTDPTAVPWFLRKTIINQPPACAPSTDVTNGPAPLRVHFAANANDPGGGIRSYNWTFDDGTFSTNANPGKVFFLPGIFRARLTVTDTDGNTATGTVTINVSTAGAVLNSATYTSNGFEFSLTGTTNLNRVIQASTDLNQWLTLWTNRGPFVFTDRMASNFPVRFYRAISAP